MGTNLFFYLRPEIYVHERAFADFLEYSGGFNEFHEYFKIVIWGQYGAQSLIVSGVADPYLEKGSRSAF